MLLGSSSSSINSKLGGQGLAIPLVLHKAQVHFVALTTAACHSQPVALRLLVISYYLCARQASSAPSCLRGASWRVGGGEAEGGGGEEERGSLPAQDAATDRHRGKESNRHTDKGQTIM